MGVEETIRRRVAEALREAKVPGWRVGQELLLLLPEDFVREYTLLLHSALDLTGGQAGISGALVGGAGAVTEVKGRREDGTKRSGGAVGMEAGAMRAARGGGKRKHRHYGLVLNEDALERKRRLDAKLRRLAREMQDDRTRPRQDSEEGNGQAKGEGQAKARRCGRCGAFLSSGQSCRRCEEGRTKGEGEGQTKGEGEGQTKGEVKLEVKLKPKPGKALNKASGKALEKTLEMLGAVAEQMEKAGVDASLGAEGLTWRWTGSGWRVEGKREEGEEESRQGSKGEGSTASNSES